MSCRLHEPSPYNAFALPSIADDPPYWTYWRYTKFHETETIALFVTSPFQANVINFTMANHQKCQLWYELQNESSSTTLLTVLRLTEKFSAFGCCERLYSLHWTRFRVTCVWLLQRFYDLHLYELQMVIQNCLKAVGNFMVESDMA